MEKHHIVKQYSVAIESEKFVEKYGREFASKLEIWFANSELSDASKLHTLHILDEAFALGELHGQPQL